MRQKNVKLLSWSRVNHVIIPTRHFDYAHIMGSFWNQIQTRNAIPKLCFIMLLTNWQSFFLADRKDFLSWSYIYELWQVGVPGIQATDQQIKRE